MSECIHAQNPLRVSNCIECTDVQHTDRLRGKYVTDKRKDRLRTQFLKGLHISVLKSRRGSTERHTGSSTTSTCRRPPFRATKSVGLPDPYFKYNMGSIFQYSGSSSQPLKISNHAQKPSHSQPFCKSQRFLIPMKQN